MALLGSGTQQDPYLISVEDDFASIVSGKAQDYKYYKITNDIELTNASGIFPIDSQKSFIEIDGDGHLLTGLRLRETRYDSTSYELWGIFKRLYRVRIKNLGIEDFVFNVYAKAGAFAGQALYTDFENCFVINSLIRGYGTARDYWKDIGGFVGYAPIQNTFTNCAYIGVTNYNTLSIPNNTIQGTSYVGGFVGYGINQVFNNCYSISGVNSTHETQEGAFVSNYHVGKATFNNCYTVRHSTTVHAQATLLDTNSYATYLRDNPTALEGFDFDNVWGTSDKINGGLPTPKVFFKIVKKIDNRLVNSYTQIMKSNIGSISRRLRDKLVSSFSGKFNSDLFNIKSANKEEVSHTERITSNIKKKVRTLKFITSYSNKIKSILTKSKRANKVLSPSFIKTIKSKLAKSAIFTPNSFMSPINSLVESFTRLVNIGIANVTSYVRSINSNSLSDYIRKRVKSINSFSKRYTSSVMKFMSKNLSAKSFVDKINSNTIDSYIMRRIKNAMSYVKSINSKTFLNRKKNEFVIAFASKINIKAIPQAIMRRFRGVKSNTNIFRSRVDGISVGKVLHLYTSKFTSRLTRFVGKIINALTYSNKFISNTNKIGVKNIITHSKKLISKIGRISIVKDITSHVKPLISGIKMINITKLIESHTRRIFVNNVILRSVVRDIISHINSIKSLNKIVIVKISTVTSYAKNITSMTIKNALANSKSFAYKILSNVSKTKRFNQYVKSHSDKFVSNFSKTLNKIIVRVGHTKLLIGEAWRTGIKARIVNSHTGRITSSVKAWFEFLSVIINYVTHKNFGRLRQRKSEIAKFEHRTLTSKNGKKNNIRFVESKTIVRKTDGGED